MRVVSLNLDHGDAAVIRRVLRQARERCACSLAPGALPCEDCRALGPALAELDRVIVRPAFPRPVVLTLVADQCTGTHGAVLTADEESELAGREPLRLMVRDQDGSGRR